MSDADNGKLTFNEEWNWFSGASKTLGAGNVTGVIGCAATLQFASSHSFLEPYFPTTIFCFLAGTILFCLGHFLLFMAYISRNLSSMQFKRWQDQENEELSLLKVGHKRTKMKGDVSANESFKSLISYSRLINFSLYAHVTSFLCLMIGLYEATLLFYRVLWM